MLKLADLETILIPNEIILYILGESEPKHFYFNHETGEYTKINSTIDMYDLYREYQLDTIWECKDNSNALNIKIRWRKDLWGQKKDI